LRKYQRESVEKRLIESGNRVKDIWRQAALAHGLEIKVSGLPTLAALSFVNGHQAESNTRFTIEMLRRGFLGFRQFKPSFAHDAQALDAYAVAVDQVFAELAADVDCSKLDTPKHHSGFQRLTKE
jgi:glutamate-1-semialdehyde 2,1-aminomutase